MCSSGAKKKRLPNERIVSRDVKQSGGVTVSFVPWNWFCYSHQLPPVRTTESVVVHAHMAFRFIRCVTLLHLPPALHPRVLGDAVCEHLPPPLLQHVGEGQRGHNGQCLLQQEVDLRFYRKKRIASNNFCS